VSDLAYPANRPDVSTAADGYRDFASKAAVEDAAWHYLTASPVVGLWHEDGTDGAGEVVESSIWRAPDWTIKAVDGSEQVIRSGDWLLGIRWSPETWPLVRDGKGRGVSMQGQARRRAPDAAALAELGKSRILAKAAALQGQADRAPDRVTAGYYDGQAARLREQVMFPADHLAKAASYAQTAAQVTDPAMRDSYERLAAAERQKAGQR
jgi:Putative phage serine protease XkdF